MTVIYHAGLTFSPKHHVCQGGGFNNDLAARVNILESFYYVAEWQTRNIHRFKRLLLDSGAFTFAFGAGASENIVWEEYADRYAAYVKANGIMDYLELDIDKLVGYPKVRELRDRIEVATGLPCRPVWHVERGKDEWFRLCDQYETVAIGGIATREGRKRLDPYLRTLVREAHKRGAEVHGLGYTSMARLHEIGFDSVDSTAWLWGNKSGCVYRWNGHEMLKEKAGPNRRVSTNATIRHNFTEWVRMAEDMEKTV